MLTIFLFWISVIRPMMDNIQAFCLETSNWPSFTESIIIFDQSIAMLKTFLTDFLIIEFFFKFAVGDKFTFFGDYFKYLVKGFFFDD